MNMNDCPIKANDDPPLMGLSDLVGAEVIETGLMDSSQLDDRVEGGFIIDYRKDGIVKRIVLGFTELGMWVEWHGEKGKKNARDLLFERMGPFIKELEIELVDGDDFATEWTLVEKPLHHKFALAKRDTEYLELGVSDLKIIGSIYGLFEDEEKDVPAIVNAIHTWFFCRAPDSLATECAR